MKKVCAIVLGLVGLLLVSGLFERLTVVAAQKMAGVDIRQYEHPTYDAFANQEPTVGAIFIVGGVLLWYLPNRRSSRG